MSPFAAGCLLHSLGQDYLERQLAFPQHYVPLLHLLFTGPSDFCASLSPFNLHRQLSRRARRIYLFREEYIFDVEKAVVVETPQLGHATYVFAKPRSMDGFLALYTKITKDDIRRNRNNAAERLGFLGRVIHGTNPRAWLKEVRQRVGEGIDFAAMAE